MTFFDGATGNPADGRRRIRPQAVRGVSSNGTWRDFLDNAGDLAINKSVVDPDKRIAGGEPVSPLPGKATIGAKVLPLGAVDPNSYSLITGLANLYGHYTKSEPTAGVHQWYFATDGATAASPLIEMADDTAVLPPTRHLDCLVSGFELAVRDKANAQFNLLVPDYDFWDEPTQTTGTGSTLPTIRGVMLEPMSEADVTGQALEIEIVSAEGTAEGDEIVYHVGLGGATPAGSYSYLLGQGPQILKDETGAEIGGGRANPATIQWEPGATLVALDVFEVLARRPRWTQTFGTRVDLAAVYSRFYLDGNLVKVEGGYTLRVAHGSSGIDQDVSFETGGSAWRAGPLMPTLELTRTVVDLLLQAGLHNRSRLAVVIDMASDLKITGVHPYVFRSIVPYLLGLGPMYTQAVGGARAQERITLRGGVPPSAYTDPVGGTSVAVSSAMVIRNGRSAL